MALKLMTKPLVASIKERLKADPSRLHRAAPPSAQQIAPVHRLPAKDERPEPMAKKNKQGRYDPDYKAKIVARVLKAKDTGEETIGAIAVAEGLHETTIYNWLAAAKKGAANGAAPSNGSVDKAKKGRPGKGDIEALSRELSEAMNHVAKLKSRLRKLLD